MFTFSHITSIGISKEEYDRRMAAGEKGLAKGENKFYREIPTDVQVPLLDSDLAEMMADDAGEDASVKSASRDEKMKLGDKTVYVSTNVKNFIVGLKLAVNQQVQTANRDGKTDYDPTITQALEAATPRSPEWLAAVKALTGKASEKKVFVEAWLAANLQE